MDAPARQVLVVLIKLSKQLYFASVLMAVVVALQELILVVKDLKVLIVVVQST